MPCDFPEVWTEITIDENDEVFKTKQVIAEKWKSDEGIAEITKIYKEAKSRPNLEVLKENCQPPDGDCHHPCLLLTAINVV